MVGIGPSRDGVETADTGDMEDLLGDGSPISVDSKMKTAQMVTI